MSSAGRACSILGLLGALVCYSPEASVVVNEVLANEPGGYVTLEWLEIYNDSSAALPMAGYQLKVDDKWIELPDSVWLDAGEYYIVCRKLLSDGQSPGFEGVWGDSSGVWGDAPQENLLQTPYEVQFSLGNVSGRVGLYDPSVILVSELSWNESGKDGFSWERVSPQSLEIAQSIDPSGSTPGLINSHTPVPNDLALEEVNVIPDNGETSITFTVTNRGHETVYGSQLFLFLDDPERSAMLTDAIDTIEIGEIEPGSTFVATQQYFFDGVYISLSASLSDDDRIQNNQWDFVATGAGFPPVVLSELLPNPKEPLATEWVEIKNRLGEPFDIAGWQLGDSLALYTIADTSVLIGADEYVVLAGDSQAFQNYYSGFNERYLQLSQWPPFNNDCDVARLVDSFGFEADRLTYTKVFDDNYTWSRSEEPSYGNDWGRSEQMGGSPGSPNSVLFEPTGRSIVVVIEPKVFSPDGDGFEDVAVITIEEAPREAELTLKIYDRQGRAVRTLIDGEDLLRSSYTWDGYSDGGNRLPIGIYILYLEATGAGSVKKPVVIAR